MFFVPQFVSFLGFAYALSGRIDEALPLLQQAEAETVSIGRTSGQSLRVNWQGEAYLLAGRLDEASSFAQRGFELSRSIRNEATGRGASSFWARPRRIRSHRTYKTPKPTIVDALTLANELGMRPLEAHCHLGLGTDLCSGQGAWKGPLRTSLGR